MAKLPDPHRARIDDEKLSGYLLNAAHKTGGAKARFFFSFGFTASDHEAFRAALVQHALDHEAAVI